MTIDATWSTFRAINERRRAIRDFDDSEIPDEDIRAVLAEALLAPSSGNLQPYEFHWVRGATKKQAVAEACEGQRAAMSAATLLVVVAHVGAGLCTVLAQRAHVDSNHELDERAKSYHRKQLDKFQRLLRLGPLMLWAPFKVVLSVLFPCLTLLPVGPAGMRHWVARSSIYAAQTLLLAASARGLDACPMEGFNPRAVARALGLPRGVVVPIVIALGRRKQDARVDARWRRSFEDAVVIHHDPRGATV